MTPTLKVYFAPGYTWTSLDSAVTWVEITSYVLSERGAGGSRGRSSELDDMRTGTFRFVLDNSTRRFDPEHATGPYSGQLLPGVPVKATATVNGTVYPVFRGFVDGWPQDYDVSNKTATVEVSCTDGFGKLARAGTPRSVIAYEVDQDSPTAVWSLDERTGLTMADASGNGYDGGYLNGVLGQDPLLEDGGFAASFEHVGDNRGLASGNALVTAYPFTLEAWVKFPRDLAAIHTFIAGTKDSALGQWVWFGCFNDGGIPLNDAGAAGLWISGGRGVQGTTRVDDDARHHVVAIAHSQTSFDIYVDGAKETEDTFESGTGLAASTIATHKLWAVGNVSDNSAGDWGLGGVIDNPAIYPSALSAARILAHYNAGTAPWDGDLTGARIARILDIVGWPSDLRDLATGETTLGWATLGADALALLKKVEAAEQGRLFMSRAGKVTFLTRYYHLEVAAGMSSQATFSDDGAAIPYTSLGYDDGASQIFNRVRGSRVGGTTIEAVDQTSINTYGEAIDSALSGIQVENDGQVRDAVEHRLLRYSEPQLRIRPLELALHGLTAAQQADVLDLELGHRVTVERTPQAVGSQIAQETIVEGIAHRISSEQWTTTLTLSPVDTRTYFTLDTSVLDGVDVLAF